MTKSAYSQRGKSGDKSIKRHIERDQEVKKAIPHKKNKHQNCVNVRKPEKAREKRQKIESSNTQTIQKARKQLKHKMGTINGNNIVRAVKSYFFKDFQNLREARWGRNVTTS
jgi:hypothetical protein